MKHPVPSQTSILEEKKTKKSAYVTYGWPPLAILDLLDELENVFDQPIHLCDVKPEHFGISDFGKVKFLDLDSVFLKSYLGEYSWVSNKADLL